MTTLGQWPSYNTLWRWHFYAGLFCIPFVLILAVTGAIYLFKPQVEASLDAPYQRLNITGQPASAAAQVSAALQAVKGARFEAYQLPDTLQSAVQVLVKNGMAVTRVYVHPVNLKILKQQPEDATFMHIVHELHGTLLLGDRGSMLVELAASWAIVMLITGLCLWWPRNTQGLAGIVYPRLNLTGRVFWRDLHGVTGFWITFFTLFLLVSGLPWTKSWGGLLKEVRQIGTVAAVKQDWATGRVDEHAGHHQAHMDALPQDHSAIDRLIATVVPLHLAAPVLIAPPSKKSPDWTAKSDAQNRPLRVNLSLDADTGAIKSRKDFADRPLLDRIIGTGIAIHEGQLFGWLNQLLGLLTALGLVLVSVSGLVMWWRRRKSGVLGAPPPGQFQTHVGFLALATTLGVLLPFLGLSVLMVLLLERAVLRRFAATRDFLGLNKIAA
ncbi:MAG: PepSY-associated TM helix domain-containing protein [Methylophilaceae bacterium]